MNTPSSHKDTDQLRPSVDPGISESVHPLAEAQNRFDLTGRPDDPTILLWSTSDWPQHLPTHHVHHISTATESHIGGSLNSILDSQDSRFTDARH